MGYDPTMKVTEAVVADIRGPDPDLVLSLSALHTKPRREGGQRAAEAAGNRPVTCKGEATWSASHVFFFFMMVNN